MNTLPTFSGVDSITYVENSPAVALFPNTTLFDAELSTANNFAGASFKVLFDFRELGKGAISAPGGYFSGTHAVIVDNIDIGSSTFFNGGIDNSGISIPPYFKISFNSNATHTLVNQAIQQISILQRRDVLPTKATINWEFNDGNTGSQGDGGEGVVSGTTTINFTNVNDAPTLLIPEGSVLTGIDTTGIDINNVALQNEGQIILAWNQGYEQIQGNNGFGLTKFNANGLLDSSFAGDGKLTDVELGLDRFVGSNIFVQPDGKILAVGTTDGIGKDFVLMRYNADGSLDSSFASNGKVITDFGNNDYGQSVTVQANGKILIAGSTLDKLALVRYNTDGSIDPSLGIDGKLLTDISPSASNPEVIVQADDKILITLTSSTANQSDFALRRYNSDGTLDATFDTDGQLITNFGTGSFQSGLDVVLQSDGKILVSGNNENGESVLRYNPDGSLDNSFDSDGKVILPVGFGSRIALQTDGKILVKGNDGLDGTSSLVRYNTDGSLDLGFGSNGYASLSLDGYVLPQADGKILIAGSSWNGLNDEFVLSRYNNDGSVDKSFGAPTYTENASAVVLDSNIIIADAELIYCNGASVSLSRHGGAHVDDVFTASGTLDPLTQGASLILHDVDFGDFDIGTVTTNAAGTLKLTFNANSTEALVNQALRQIAYSNSSEAPPASIQMDWIFSDGNSGAQGIGGEGILSKTSLIKISAVNDAPTLATPTAVNFTDTNADDSFANLSGNLSASDLDGDTLTYGISGATINSGLASKTGTYGTLSVNTSTGAYTFAPNDQSIEGLKANTSESFAVSVTDGIATTMATYTVNLTATNDTPVSTASPLDKTYSDTDSDDLFSAVNGSITTTDRDANDTASYSITGAANNNSLVGFDLAKTGSYGLLFLNSSTGDYRFVPNDNAIEALKANVSESFYFVVSDGTVTTSHTFTANLIGANDQTNFSGTIAGNVVEDGVNTASGTLIVSDRDTGDAVINAQSNTAGAFGSFSIDTNGAWTYSLNNSLAQIQALKGGQEVTDSFSVNTSGGATQTVVISINGTNDIPTMDTPVSANYTDTSIDDSFSNTLGSLSANDPDGDVLAYVIEGGSVSAGVSSKTGIYGTLSVTSATGAYSFIPNDLAIESLKTNATESFMITASDGKATTNAIYTANITGANDSAGFNGDKSGIVSKSSSPNITGQLAVLDRDQVDALFVAQTNQNTAYGSFTISETGAWNYSLNSTAASVLALKAGHSITETIEVSSLSGDTQDITLVIKGGTNTSTSGNDNINSGDGDNTINAGDGKNTVTSGSGNDNIASGTGNDTINAGNGDNTINAGNGANKITSGTGNDAIDTGLGNDTVNAGDGNNTINAGGGANKITTGSGDDALISGDGKDTINAGGGNNIINAGNGINKITSGSGDDTITTGVGKDTILAGDGNNTIISGGGNDKIVMGAGNDVINGGAGKDVMSGGSGKDVFVFDNLAAGSIDKILDFDGTHDLLKFDDAVFTALAGGLSSDNLVVGARAVAHDSNDVLLFDSNKSVLSYDADGNGAGAAVALVTLAGVNTVHVDDFWFF